MELVGYNRAGSIHSARGKNIEWLGAGAAANALSGAKRFGTKETKFTDSQTLYNLVQCLPDLSSFDCNRCLRESITNLSTAFRGKRGGRVLNPSCNVRYEVFAFYNLVQAVPAPKGTSLIKMMFIWIFFILVHGDKILTNVSNIRCKICSVQYAFCKGILLFSVQCKVYIASAM